MSSSLRLFGILCLTACSDKAGGETHVPSAAGASSLGAASAGGSAASGGRPMDRNGGAAGLGSSGTSSVGGALAGSGSAGAPPFDPGDDPNDFPGQAPGKIFDATIPPLGEEKFAKASYRIYIPDGLAELRGIIIRQHGCGRNGMDMAYDLHWQVLANKWAFALLGTHYEDGGSCANWASLDSGSVQALQRGLLQFATDAQRPELSTVPWAIWGHSGGGDWAYAVGAMYPERVIAVVPRSGARGELSDAARSVPQLVSAGQLEQGHAQFGNAYAEIAGAFERERPLGALLALSLDPEATHEIREGRLLAIPYLDACIRLRVPNRAGEPLRAIAETVGWLGNVSSFEVASFTDYAGDKSSAAWLPNESVARKWAEFAKTGRVVDTSPPPSPRTLMAVREGTSVRLSWTADADFDSGIKHFFVYRGNTKLAEVGSPFQQGNFGDEPEPSLPVMTYSDVSATANPAYEVSTVNFFDLESGRSPAASP